MADKPSKLDQIRQLGPTGIERQFGAGTGKAKKPKKRSAEQLRQALKTKRRRPPRKVK